MSRVSKRVFPWRSCGSKRQRRKVEQINRVEIGVRLSAGTRLSGSRSRGIVSLRFRWSDSVKNCTRRRGNAPFRGESHRRSWTTGRNRIAPSPELSIIGSAANLSSPVEPRLSWRRGQHFRARGETCETTAKLGLSVSLSVPQTFEVNCRLAASILSRNFRGGLRKRSPPTSSVSAGKFPRPMRRARF